MATNPLYSANQSPNGATQPTKAVNNQAVKVHRTANTFDNSFFHYKTQKFGQIEPFYFAEGIPRDHKPLHSSHNVRALPFSSPFLPTLKLNKDYFLVPNQAIQPNSWEYIFKQPSQGDDVPDDAQNLFPTVVNSQSLYCLMVDKFVKFFNGDSSMDQTDFAWLTLCMESIFSSGSLLSNLGYKYALRFAVDEADRKWMSFDDLFDTLWRDAQIYGRILTDSVDFTFSTDESSSYNTGVLVDNYTALSLLRRFGSDCTANVVFAADSLPYLYKVAGLPDSSDDSLQFFRMDRVCAYQLSCAQYYVNPQVDFIYNSQLFRDNWFTLLRNVLGTTTGVDVSLTQFNLNGIGVTYDFFSTYYYRYFVESFIQQLDVEDGYCSQFFDLFHYLFGFRESLKFGDYFTDARTRALAPGVNSVPVVSNGVSVIDMSRNIIMQRFRNAVVKLGNNFEDYLKGIFGSSPSPDYHYPKFISHNDFVITGNEVNNTSSSDQGKIVTNLQSADDTFAFEVAVDMPCIVLGLSYFSLPRVYSQTKDRFFFHKDRFDMFDPILQYDIDQPVYNSERNDSINTANNRVFGYQSRFNEYKQRYSIASGGFLSTLPSWVFITDSETNPVVDFQISKVQSPEFIRANDFEFNRFMQRVPGLSLANGFHFIVSYNNKCVETRPLEVNPQTL